jgi:adenine phosphoribosyltransferase
VRLNDERMIAGFTPFGDVELTCACAAELLKKVPDCDYLIAPEAKASRSYTRCAPERRNTYLLVRKAPKLYMDGVFEADVQSITTEGAQKLYMDGAGRCEDPGRRVVIIDDVISTGRSLAAIETLVEKAGGIVAGRAAVLRRGRRRRAHDIVYLAPLPLFDKNGKPLK